MPPSPATDPVDSASISPERSDRAPRRVLVLVNPNSRQGDQPLDAVVGHLEEAGLTAHVETFDDPGEITRDIVRRAREVDTLLVCGGDGTINAAAPGILASGLPFGIIPLGTGNDLARTLGIPLDPVAAAGVLVAGRTRRIDLGEVNGHPFFNVASVGLSAELAQTLSRDVKRRFGRFGYALAAIAVLARARPFTAHLSVGSEASRARTYQIAVGNGRHYGGGLTVATDAAIDDGHFDVYSLEFTSVWKLALMLPAFRSGAHGAWREVRTIRATDFEIRTRRPRPVNADGELVTTTPARFRIRPKAVTVFVPAARDDATT